MVAHSKRGAPRPLAQLLAESTSASYSVLGAVQRSKSSLQSRLLSNTRATTFGEHREGRSTTEPSDNRLDDAALSEARFRVTREPKNARAWNLLATILAERKEFSESRHCYEVAISLEPNMVEWRHNLANVLQMLGQSRDAEVRYREVLEIEPGNLLARVNYACLLNMLGRYGEASAAVEDVIGRNPRFARAWQVASSIEHNCGRYGPALERLDRAIALAPGEIRNLVARAEILCKLGRHEDALADCGAVLSRVPSEAEALRVKAFVLRTLHRPDEALVALRAAQSASFSFDIVVEQAWLLAEMGRKDEALLLLDRVLAQRPDFAAALYCRAFLVGRDPGHKDVTLMERIATDPEAPGKDRMRLSFSLGKIYLAAGDGEKAFAWLDRANALKRATIAYDCASDRRLFADIMELFSKAEMAGRVACGLPTAKPIFVFGMPRSGTTLVEQILASHPLVHAKGETPHMKMLANSSILPVGRSALSVENLQPLAGRYVQLVGDGVPAALHFVDKTPSNFLYVGLIALLFPGARMIHCRRDALETCLSCYSLLFAHGHEFAYSQVELGQYYGLYRKMMAHWREVLPADAMLHVDYESLVSSTEDQIRRILEFCSLPYDKACLRFHETKRMVTTASLDQVRAPIYGTSVHRARKFRPWLRALEQSLSESVELESLKR